MEENNLNEAEGTEGRGKNIDEALDNEQAVQKQDLLPKDSGKEDLLPEDTGPKKESKLEHDVEEVAEELDIHLAHVDLPLPIKIIALFTLVGGLSIIGNAFVNIFALSDVNVLLYLWGLVVGVLAIFIAYGLIKKERWAVWVYGILVLVALIGNFLVAIIPAAIVVYLYTQKHFFRPSVFDAVLLRIIKSIER